MNTHHQAQTVPTTSNGAFIDDDRKASVMWCTFVESGPDLTEYDQATGHKVIRGIWPFRDSKVWRTWRESYESYPAVSLHSRETARASGAKTMSDILSREEQSSRGDNTPVPARIEQDLLSFFTSGVRVATALNATMDDLSEKIDAQHKSIKSMYERDCTGDRFELHFPSRKGLVCANPFVKLPWVPVEIDKDQHRSDIEEKWRNYIVGDISAIRQPDDGTILVPVIYRPPEVVRAARMAGWTDEEEDTRTK